MTQPFGHGRPVFLSAALPLLTSEAREETQDMSCTFSHNKIHKGKILPAGIRMRGEKFFVDVTRDGIRKTATCLSLREAKTKRDSLLTGVAEGPMPPQPWTFKEAFNSTWRGKHHNKAYRLGLQALAYFGPNSCIGDVLTADMDDYVDHLRLQGNGPALSLIHISEPTRPY